MVVTNYHYDGNSINVLYETDGSGNLTNLYTYSSTGVLLSLTKSGQTYYYHYNGHGDVVQLTDFSGNIVASYTYDAWGNILSSSGSMAASNPYRYAGYRYDTETGMYYLMARYYSPNLGRFISRDAIDSINLYAYCENNPVNRIDPTGYVEMELREAVNEAGGTIKWNKKTGVATATIGGITRTYNIKNYKVKNNRIMVDSSKVAKDFGMNVYAVEGRRTLTQTGTYLKSDQAFKAYKQTGIAIWEIGIPKPLITNFLPSIKSGNESFDTALGKTNNVRLFSPSTGREVIQTIKKWR